VDPDKKRERQAEFRWINEWLLKHRGLSWVLAIGGAAVLFGLAWFLEWALDRIAK
jgi:hypothetical protein